MKQVRIALLGVNHPHSLSHLKTLQHSSLVSDVVVYDTDEVAVERVVEEAGNKVVEGPSDLEYVLNESGAVAAFACFRNDLNAALCLETLRAGIHVLSEKPIGKSAREVGEVVQVASECDLKVGVMYQNRWHPVSREARRLVKEGVIGRITACESRMVTSQVQFRDPEHWLFKAEIAGGGILSWLGCHHIDLLQYVMDDEITEVSAITDTLSGEDINVEDVASLSFRFESGALGSIQAGYQLAMSGSGYIGPSYDSYVGFRGTEGRLYWDPKTPVLHVESANESWRSSPLRTFEYSLPPNDAYGGAYGVSFVDTFISSALGEGHPPASGDDAYRVARILEAAYQSNQTGRRINVA